MTLSARDFLEASQVLDVVVDVRDAVHGVITMSAPSRRQPSAAAVQTCSSGLCIRSQASIPNLAESRPNDLSCSSSATHPTGDEPPKAAPKVGV
jgi:hypothetical protein